MPRIAEETVATAAPQNVTLTTEQLQLLLNTVAQSQNSGQSTNLQVLVDAIVESRKPFVDPKAIQNEEEFRRGAREQEKFKRSQIRAAQDNCPHTKGQGGSAPSSHSAFWMHRLDTGETIGICSNCQKVISSLNPDDTKWFRLGGDNQAGGAGVRTFMHPLKAMLAPKTPEERTAIEARLAQGN